MTILTKLKFYIVPAVVVVALYSALWAIPAPKGSAGRDTDFLSSGADDIKQLNSTLPDIMDVQVVPPDTGLRVPLPQPENNPLNEYDYFSPFHLNNPPSLSTYVEYDPESNTYNFQNMTGSVPYGPGAYMDVDEYIDYDLRNEIRNYWRNKGAGYSSGVSRTGSGLIPQLRIGGDIFESIFGSGKLPSLTLMKIFNLMCWQKLEIK